MRGSYPRIALVLLAGLLAAPAVAAPGEKTESPPEERVAAEIAKLRERLSDRHAAQHDDGACREHP